MNVLCWRSEYVVGGSVSYVEWFVATNYGIGQFRIRAQGKMRPTIDVLSEIKTPGWLKDAGLNGVIRHAWLRKQQARSTEHNARAVPIHQESIDALNETWMLDRLFQHDTRAHNAWCNLTGIPVGTTYEQIAVKAEAEVAAQREAKRVEKVAIMAEIDDEWGMF